MDVKEVNASEDVVNSEEEDRRTNGSEILIRSNTSNANSFCAEKANLLVMKSEIL